MDGLNFSFSPAVIYTYRIYIGVPNGIYKFALIYYNITIAIVNLPQCKKCKKCKRTYIKLMLVKYRHTVYCCFQEHVEEKMSQKEILSWPQTSCHQPHRENTMCIVLLLTLLIVMDNSVHSIVQQDIIQYLTVFTWQYNRALLAAIHSVFSAPFTVPNGIT